MATAVPLADRHAVVFAASGAIAGATAMTLATEGANVCLSGRDRGRLEDLARQILAVTGRAAEVALVDATDRGAVAGYLRSLAGRGVVPDLVFNGIGLDPLAAGYGVSSFTLGRERFLAPLERIVGSQFLTATLAAESMRERRRGTIVLLTSSLARSAYPCMAGITAASDAVEGLARVLAVELAPWNLRVVCVRVDGIPATRTIRLTTATLQRTLGTASSPPPEGSDRAPALTLRAAAQGIVAAALAERIDPEGRPVDVAAAHGGR